VTVLAWLISIRRLTEIFLRAAGVDGVAAAGRGGEGVGGELQAEMSAADRIATNLRGGAAQRQAGYRELEELARAATGASQNDGAAARAKLEALRAELMPMKMTALRKRALAAGVDEGDLEGAVDADDPTAAIVSLLLDGAVSHAGADRVRADTAVACVVPLCAVLCKDASEVGVEEYQRATTALLGLAPLDIDRVAAEVTILDKGHCAVATARGSVFGRVVGKSPAELTPEDALIYAGQQGVMNLMWPRTMQASFDIAGVAWADFMPSHVAASHLFGGAVRKDDAFNLSLVTLIMGLLRSAAVPGVLLSGAIHSMVHAVEKQIGGSGGSLEPPGPLS
jgi:hypothetical protein